MKGDQQRITQHIRLTSFAQISASPKLRICWERYMKFGTVETNIKDGTNNIIR